MGCTDNKTNDNTTTSGCDIAVNDVSIADNNPHFLGGTIPLKLNITSDNDKEYTISVRINNKVVFTDQAVSNYSGILDIPAKYDGVNATISVRATPNRCIDTHSSNNQRSTVDTIYPITNFNHLDLNHSVRIFDNRMIATPLELPSEIYLQSIGFYLQSDLIFSPNSTLVFYLYKDMNNSPGDQLMNLTTLFVRISKKWSLVLLNSKEPLKLSPGKYWLGAWLNDDAYANVLCYEDPTNSSLSSRVIMGETAKWNTMNCTPYYVIGGSDALSTYSGLQELSKLYE